MEKKESYPHIYHLFTQIMKLSFAEAFPHFHELNMHPAQAELLYILYQNPGITQSSTAWRNPAMSIGKRARISARALYF